MKKKSAFSLVEISIVIVIISVIIAGALQGSRVVRKSRLLEAQILTEKSPVNDISDLISWHETSLDSSFNEDEAKDGASVSTWYDHNPNALTKKNATQATALNQPKFIKNVFYGSIPALRFDGEDFLNFNGSELIGTSYTMFIVEQRRAAGARLPLIGGDDNPVDQNIRFTYQDNFIVVAQQGNGVGVGTKCSVPAYTSPVPRIHSLIHNPVPIGTLGILPGSRYWLNGGGSNGESNDTTNVDYLIAYDSPFFGRNGSDYFNGDIAEVILFKRALQDGERLMVEDYLSKKYNIAITSSCT